MKAREVRITIVSELYKKGYTYRDIQREVMNRLGLNHYSLGTLSKDVKVMLAEWREHRLENLDESLSVELARIDKMLVELWAAWERSKNPKGWKKKTQTGKPGKSQAEEGIKATGMQQSSGEEEQFGDPRYMDLINKVLQERRKMLGLYKEPEQVINVKPVDKPIIVFKDIAKNE